MTSCAQKVGAVCVCACVHAIDVAILILLVCMKERTLNVADRK